MKITLDLLMILMRMKKLACLLEPWILKKREIPSKLVVKLIPFPKKFFSFIPPPIVEPLVPTPAERAISPVGCSSTIISIIFKFSLVPFFILPSTFLKILKLLILSIDLLYSRLLRGSPSSTINLFLITSSIVWKFPKILILST